LRMLNKHNATESASYQTDISQRALLLLFILIFLMPRCFNGMDWGFSGNVLMSLYKYRFTNPRKEYVGLVKLFNFGKSVVITFKSVIKYAN